MSGPRSNRRDFLRGKAAARAVEHVTGEIIGGLADSLPVKAQQHYLIKYSQKAMACQFEIWLNAGHYEHGPETAINALELILQLEDQLTVYRDQSEVSQLNRLAASEPVKVEYRLFALLSRSIDLWRQTEGAFDITAGPLSELWGFKRREGKLPDGDAIAGVLSRVGSQYLLLDPTANTVAFLRDGVEINLGGIGKGYALDRCSELFLSAEIQHYLLHGGSSSVCARGNNASREDGGWSVGVRNPLRPKEYLGEIILRDRSLSTSSAAHQQFTCDGKTYGHILDPRTGWPAEGVISATVVADSAAEAEALSTAFYVSGLAVAEAFCASRTDIGCVIICGDHSGRHAICHPLNLGSSDWLPH